MCGTQTGVKLTWIFANSKFWLHFYTWAFESNWHTKFLKNRIKHLLLTHESNWVAFQDHWTILNTGSYFLHRYRQWQSGAVSQTLMWAWEKDVKQHRRCFVYTSAWSKAFPLKDLCNIVLVLNVGENFLYYTIPSSRKHNTEDFVADLSRACDVSCLGKEMETD